MAGFNLKTRKNKKRCELSATEDKKTWKQWVTVEHLRFAARRKKLNFFMFCEIGLLANKLC